MNLTPEQLIEIEEFAALHFSNDEIAIIMEVCETKLQCNSAKKAISKGRLKSEAEVWQSIFRLAKQGSSPAQTLAIARINKLKLKSHE